MSKSFLSKFESELKSKLSQKSYGSTKEETILLKAFKYFDLDNSGTCSKNEFIKTVYKIGLVGFSTEDLSEIFSIYDVDNSGLLDYKEFTSILYGNKSIHTRKKEQPEEIEESNYKEKEQDREVDSHSQSAYSKQQKISVPTILAKIRSKLACRGVKSICSMAKNFRLVDENNSQTINFDEFLKATQMFQFNLTKEETKAAFEAFDRDNSGEIDYDEFLRSVRGEMNEFRQKLVKQVFSKIDTDKSGKISMEELSSKYNAEAHPDVVNGKRTPEEVYKIFMDTFQDTYNYLCGTESDNVVTLEEFMEYYENVSMNIDDDSVFESIINNTWRINEHTTGKNESKGWNNSSQDGDKEKLQNKYKEKYGSRRPAAREGSIDLDRKYKLVRKLKKEVLNRGIGGLIELHKHLRILDEDNTKKLELEQFRRALKQFKSSLSHDEVNTLYTSYAPHSLINYEDLVNDIRGELNSKREAAVLQAFAHLDVDGSGVIDIADLRSMFNSKNNRDVKAGRKTEEEVFREFIETFQMHHNIMAGLRNKRVTKEEFIDYYSCLSSAIPDDDNFIKMVQNAWKLNPNYTGDFSKINTQSPSKLSQSSKISQSETGSRAAPFGTDDNQGEEYDNRHKKNAKNLHEKNNELGLSPIEKLQQTLACRGVRGIMSMRRAFMIADENNNKSIDLKEFQNFIHNYRIPLTEDEINQIFITADLDNSGIIEYEEFIRMIAGTLNERRQNAVTRAFNKLDSKGEGIISIEKLRNSFDPSHHPECVIGKKSEDEVLGEFLDTLDYHFNLLNDSEKKTDAITLGDFLEFYNYISMSIPNDYAFETMINGVYHLDSKRR